MSFERHARIFDVVFPSTKFKDVPTDDVAILRPVVCFMLGIGSIPLAGSNTDIYTPTGVHRPVPKFRYIKSSRASDGTIEHYSICVGFSEHTSLPFSLLKHIYGINPARIKAVSLACNFSPASGSNELHLIACVATVTQPLTEMYFTYQALERTINVNTFNPALTPDDSQIKDDTEATNPPLLTAPWQVVQDTRDRRAVQRTVERCYTVDGHPRDGDGYQFWKNLVVHVPEASERETSAYAATVAWYLRPNTAIDLTMLGDIWAAAPAITEDIYVTMSELNPPEYTENGPYRRCVQSPDLRLRINTIMRRHNTPSWSLCDVRVTTLYAEVPMAPADIMELCVFNTRPLADNRKHIAEGGTPGGRKRVADDAQQSTGDRKRVRIAPGTTNTDSNPGEDSKLTGVMNWLGDLF